MQINKYVELVGGVLGENNLYNQDCPVCHDDYEDGLTHLYSIGDCKHGICRSCGILSVRQHFL